MHIESRRERIDGLKRLTGKLERTRCQYSIDFVGEIIFIDHPIFTNDEWAKSLFERVHDVADAVAVTFCHSADPLTWSASAFI